MAIGFKGTHFTPSPAEDQAGDSAPVDADVVGTKVTPIAQSSLLNHTPGEDLQPTVTAAVNAREPEALNLSVDLADTNNTVVDNTPTPAPGGNDAFIEIQEEPDTAKTIGKAGLIAGAGIVAGKFFGAGKDGVVRTNFQGFDTLMKEGELSALQQEAHGVATEVEDLANRANTYQLPGDSQQVLAAAQSAALSDNPEDIKQSLAAAQVGKVSLEGQVTNHEVTQLEGVGGANQIANLGNDTISVNKSAGTESANKQVAEQQRAVPDVNMTAAIAALGPAAGSAMQGLNDAVNNAWVEYNTQQSLPNSSRQDLVASPSRNDLMNLQPLGPNMLGNSTEVSLA